LGIQVIAVARRATGEPGRERRRAAFEVGTRADRVRVDDDARITKRHMLASCCGEDRLIVDAGVRHADAEPRKGFDGTALEFDHPFGLTEIGSLGEIGAARIGDGRNPYATLVGIRQAL
jgi:hypothetical protein